MPNENPPDLKINNRLKHCWGKAGWWRSKHGDTEKVNSWGSAKPVPAQYVTKEMQFPVWKWNGTYSQEDCPRTTIHLRATKWLPEVLYENTLIHEMCHIYCYLNGLWAGEGGHDGWFRMISEKIKTATNGKYEILARVSDDASELCRDINDPPGFSVALKLNGTVSYSFRSVVPKMATNIGRRPQRHDGKEPNVLFFWFEDEESAKQFIVNAFNDPSSVFGARNSIVWGPKGAEHARFELANLMSSDSSFIQDQRKKGWPGWIKRHSIMVENGVPESLTNQKLFGSYKIMRVYKALRAAKALNLIKWVENRSIGEAVEKSDGKNLELVFEGVLTNALRSIWDALKRDIEEIKRSLNFSKIIETEQGWEIA